MGRLLSGKIVKIIIYDEGRINGGTNYDFPGPRWVPKLGINRLLELDFKNNYSIVISVTTVL